MNFPDGREFFWQSTNWKACSDIRQKEVISGATSRNGRYFFERINRVSNLPAQVKLLHSFNLKRLVSKTVWGFFDIPIGCFVIFLSSSVIKILLIGVTPGDHCGRSISKNGKAPHVFLDCYLRSLRTKFEVNPYRFHTLLILPKKTHSRKNEVGFFRFQSFSNISRL